MFGSTALDHRAVGPLDHARYAGCDVLLWWSQREGFQAGQRLYRAIALTDLHLTTARQAWPTGRQLASLPVWACGVMGKLVGRGCCAQTRQTLPTRSS